MVIVILLNAEYDILFALIMRPMHFNISLLNSFFNFHPQVSLTSFVSHSSVTLSSLQLHAQLCAGCFLVLNNFCPFFPSLSTLRKSIFVSFQPCFLPILLSSRPCSTDDTFLLSLFFFKEFRGCRLLKIGLFVFALYNPRYIAYFGKFFLLSGHCYSQVLYHMYSIGL